MQYKKMNREEFLLLKRPAREGTAMGRAGEEMDLMEEAQEEEEVIIKKNRRIYV
jgi:hypothetical protein